MRVYTIIPAEMSTRFRYPETTLELKFWKCPEKAVKSAHLLQSKTIQPHGWAVHEVDLAVFSPSQSEYIAGEVLDLGVTRFKERIPLKYIGPLYAQIIDQETVLRAHEGQLPLNALGEHCAIIQTDNLG